MHELRQKWKADLLSQLKDLKAELALLSIAKVTSGALCMLLFSIDFLRFEGRS